MGDFTIYYCSCTCSGDMFKNLFKNTENIPGQQVQKYHRLFAKGFVKNGIDTKMITLPPIMPSNFEKKYFRGYKENVNGIEYRYQSVCNLPFFKSFFGVFSVFNSIIKLEKKNRIKKTAIICDVLNRSVALGSLLAAKITGCPCIGIVTDLPSMISDDPNGFSVKLNNLIISKFDKYVFLTEEMNSVLNPDDKPYVVLEGHVDCDVPSHSTNDSDIKKNDKFICSYTGALFKKYGVKTLAEAFIKANLPEAELWFFGDGDYKEELKKICKSHTNIKYFGVLFNDEIVEYQRKADLLINPRPTCETFTKYSFPSKNMEYMLSGTPVLTTKLQGMPHDYYDYVFVFESETVEGMAKDLTDIYKKDQKELKEKGIKAQNFVLKNKNCVIQSKKIIDMIF